MDEAQVPHLALHLQTWKAMVAGSLTGVQSVPATLYGLDFGMQVDVDQLWNCEWDSCTAARRTILRLGMRSILSIRQLQYSFHSVLELGLLLQQLGYIHRALFLPNPCAIANCPAHTSLKVTMTKGLLPCPLFLPPRNSFRTGSDFPLLSFPFSGDLPFVRWHRTSSTKASLACSDPSCNAERLPLGSGLHFHDPRNSRATELEWKSVGPKIIMTFLSRAFVVTVQF